MIQSSEVSLAKKSEAVVADAQNAALTKAGSSVAAKEAAKAVLTTAAVQILRELARLGNNPKIFAPSVLALFATKAALSILNTGGGDGSQAAKAVYDAALEVEVALPQLEVAKEPEIQYPRFKRPAVDSSAAEPRTMVPARQQTSKVAPKSAASQSTRTNTQPTPYNVQYQQGLKEGLTHLGAQAYASVMTRGGRVSTQQALLYGQVLGTNRAHGVEREKAIQDASDAVFNTYGVRI